MNNLVPNCKFDRRFGIEIELNTKEEQFVRPKEGEIMPGSDRVGHIVQKASGDFVQIQGWNYVHNNDMWVIKYDMSCGIEINSPVLKGWRGLSKLLSVVEALGEDWPHCDERCSMHVHIDVKDLTKEQVACIVAYYIKCEHLFFDSVPKSRKNNRYCQPIGLCEFDHDKPIDIDDLLESVSDVKYYSMNIYHLMKGGGFTPFNKRKKTIEFRIAENNACIDPKIAKNWVRLLLHFVEIAKDLPFPSNYKKNDPWSGLLWINTEDMFKMLKFDGPLSPGLNQTKNWFMKRLYEFGYDSNIKNGIWSKSGRIAARNEFLKIYEKTIFDQEENAIFGDNWII